MLAGVSVIGSAIEFIKQNFALCLFKLLKLTPIHFTFFVLHFIFFSTNVDELQIESSLCAITCHSCVKCLISRLSSNVYLFHSILVRKPVLDAP